MLLEFGARNLFSFKEGFQLSMRLNKSCPESISKGKNYTNILALKGANASGKTSVLKAITFLTYYARFSFEIKPEEAIPFDNYFNNSDPTDIYIVFEENLKEYKYEITLNNQKVFNEKLFINNKLMIERSENNKLVTYNKEFKELEIIKIRDKVSFISTAKQYELNCINTIYDFFNRALANVTLDGLQNELVDYKFASSVYHNYPDIFEFVKQVLIKSDTGISDIIIKKDEDKETGNVTYFPVFIFNISGKKRYLPYHTQSSGVKSLFKQLGGYKETLDDGGLLIMDEFDINIHPDLLPILLNFFDSSKLNPKNAQLIFTTHNTQIMDMLKKYRVILVNKEDNESFLYRLDEIENESLRNDRSLAKLYDTGRIGGKPVTEFDYE